MVCLTVPCFISENLITSHCSSFIGRRGLGGGAPSQQGAGWQCSTSVEHYLICLYKVSTGDCPINPWGYLLVLTSSRSLAAQCLIVNTIVETIYLPFGVVSETHWEIEIMFP